MSPPPAAPQPSYAERARKLVQLAPAGMLSTVSRRHAIVVREGPGEVRVLDDRSLNGVFVNGELTDWGTLADSDELMIGR